MADEAKVLYPFVITLQEVLRTYVESCARVEEPLSASGSAAAADGGAEEAAVALLVASYQRDSQGKLAEGMNLCWDSDRLETYAVALLVASYQRDSQGKLAEGMNLCWDSDRLETYVKRLAEIVYIFESKAEFALQQHEKAIREIDTIQEKPIDAPYQDILAVLQNVQKMIEEQHLQNYSNIRDWTKVLENRVETILTQRLIKLVEEWTVQFEDWPNKGTALIQNGLVLEIQVRNQVLRVHPPVEAARQLWMGSLHRVVASVCLLPRFNSRNSSRALKFGGDPTACDYEDSDEENIEHEDPIKPQTRGTYRAIASRIPADVLNRAHAAIDRVMEKVEDYVANWMHYQVLWDVDVSEVLGKLGDDIETWQQLLNEIKQARSPFDASEARIMFGPTIIDHHQVQAKLNTRYDAWHRDILHAFAQKVSANASSVFTSLHAMVVDLEEQGQTADPTDTTMNAATFLSMSEAQMSALISSQGLISDELISNIVSNLTKFYILAVRVMEKVEDYVANWMHYQVLWDVDVSEVLGKLGDDIETWQQLLNEIKQARSPFDASEARIMFGPTIIDHHQVQAKLNTRYDAWHRDILHAFAQKVSANASSVFTSLHAMVVDLEEQGQTADPTDTTMNAATFLSMSEAQMSALISSQGLISDELISNIVSNLTKFLLKLQEASKLEPKWSSTIDTLRASERLLERQRFTFPSDWLWTDRIEGEMEPTDTTMNAATFLSMSEAQMSALISSQGLISDELISNIVSNLTKFLLKLQEASKLEPKWSSTIDTLRASERLLERQRFTFPSDWLWTDRIEGEMEVFSQLLRHQGMMVEQVRENLITLVTQFAASLQEKLQQLYSDWMLQRPVRDDIAPGHAMNILRKYEQQLEKITSDYECGEKAKAVLGVEESTFGPGGESFSPSALAEEIADMKGSRMHSETGYSLLLCRKSLTDMTIGNLWDADLAASEGDIRDVLVQAQGESALEEFLRQVKDSWREREFVTVPCGGKCKVIKGWEELFQIIDDQLASIQSMKMSPFFKIFEEEALAWDEKLNRLRILLDSWVEVQRKWLYLEGVFSGSQDIQMLLPAEHQRFRGIDAEFKSIMKKADTTKVVLEVYKCSVAAI
ncbi:Dynein heavy chain, related [Eimeria mitis]|uniref:Dynein heavy chain, related n=1 Tax=Eimeria mitis TaxID=44415 RepID=U6JWC9_9EIME|nr:Dynein heavy chain, related [Eimeria mitis]CDJ29729.1 Dynein heavy chain, related [Eimeria mitis]